MRTILVLTDFSPAARNGAELALHLARQLTARLLLVHIYQLPMMIEVKDPSSYPLEAELQGSHDPNYQLQQEVIRLLQVQLDQPGYPVGIETCSVQGTFAEGLRFFADKEILLAVSGDHHQHDDIFDRTDHVSDSEHLLNCPLLVVPSVCNASSHIRCIAFATDLAKNDLQALEWLHQIARRINSQLFTGHVSLPVFNMPAAEETAAGVFMAGMEKLGIPLHTYQNYFAEDIPETIREFCSDKHADLLAMVYKKHSGLRHWLYGSTTADLLFRHEKLLLLIPENAALYGW